METQITELTKNLESLNRDTVDQVMAAITTYGMDVLGAVLILIAGWMIAGWVHRRLKAGLQRFKAVDEMLAGFFSALAKYAILIVTVIAVLSQFGVETTSLIAVFGAAGLAIGLALQGTLSNIAAGVMMLLLRPFKVGDYIVTGGEGGTVKALGLFTTELATPDNVKIVIPNNQIWGNAITNYSAHDKRRMDLVYGISYDDDINKAFDIIEKELKADKRVLADPVPQTMVSGLGESAVDITARIWVASSDYWAVKFDLTKLVKEKLEAGGCSIPFPQRTVHMIQSPAPKPAAKKTAAKSGAKKKSTSSKKAA